MARWFVLVSIDIGQPLRFSTDTVHVTRADSSDVLNYVGGLLEVSMPTIGDVLTMLDRLGFVRQIPEPLAVKVKAKRVRS